MIQLTDIRVRHDELWIEETSRRMSKSKTLQLGETASDQLDALFLLTDVWFKRETVFASPFCVISSDSGSASFMRRASIIFRTETP